MMTQAEMQTIMERVFEECTALRVAGQKEYAHNLDNAFRNFQALATDLGLPQEKVLWVYLKKHLDGILAHINGHKSQRESVKGRINDAIVYLCLLRGMVEETIPGPRPGEMIAVR